MKKGLLLSVVASGLIYAGGDIAPVQPVQPTAAPAACDFWGTLAFRADINKDNVYNFGHANNNVFTTAVVLGVEKELGYGFGVGAEIAARFKTDSKFNKIAGVNKEEAELSQLYLTYKAGNTTIKAGRQALPIEVSPLAWSWRDGGILDRTYNGVVVVNSDLKDTTLIGAWIRSYTDTSGSTKIGDKGVFMLGAINKSIANTTLSFAGYIAPDYAGSKNYYSAWGSADSKIGSLDVGAQIAYAKLQGAKATLGVAAYVGGEFDAFDAKLTLAYINNGQTPIVVGASSGFWGDSFDGLFGGDADSALGKQKIARLDLGYSLDNGSKVYAAVAADKPDASNKNTAVAAAVGYDFKLLDMDVKVEYRYHKDFDKNKNHRIRLEGVYKF
jgi:hypothetical protein